MWMKTLSLLAQATDSCLSLDVDMETFGSMALRAMELFSLSVCSANSRTQRPVSLKVPVDLGTSGEYNKCSAESKNVKFQNHHELVTCIAFVLARPNW